MASETPSRRGIAGLLALMLLTIALGLYDAKYAQLYVFAYIMTIAYSISRVRRGGSWSDIGIKRGLVQDLRKVWYYFGLDAILFQLAPPTLAVAFLLGFYPELLSHITGRLPVGIGSVGALLAAALVLTLMEELVFRATIQERLGWFIGTPLAILFTSVLFGAVHALGTTGSAEVILTDVAGVALDGAFFGIIYAKTHNLPLTWATHYAADVIGLVALATYL